MTHNFFFTYYSFDIIKVITSTLIKHLKQLSIPNHYRTIKKFNCCLLLDKKKVYRKPLKICERKNSLLIFKL